MSPLDFWYLHLGRHLSGASPTLSTKAPIPTRLGNGAAREPRVAPNPLGAGIGCHYIVTPAHAWLIGRIALEDTPLVTFVPTDRPADAGGVRGDQFVARWLIDEATTPFLVGTIGNANPNASLTLSRHEKIGVFCDTGGGFRFDLTLVRADERVIRALDIDWPTIGQALHLYEEDRRSARHQNGRIAARARLDKILSKHEALRDALPRLHVRPRSGEYELLRLRFSR